MMTTTTTNPHSNQQIFPTHHQRRDDYDDNDNDNNNDDDDDVRLYQVWKGNNVFSLGGRLIFGPDVRSLYLTLFLIVTPVLLFCCFLNQKLVSEFPHHLGRLIVAIPAVLTAYILILLVCISGRDPGIIPRNPHTPEPEDEGDVSSLSTDWTGSQSAAPYLPPTKSIIVNGRVIRVKYCTTCMLYRPPRCSHCSICNNCVERFDHHCPWVGQCIGKRNYRYFFLFVSSTTLLCLYVFAFSLVTIKKIMVAYNCNLWKALLKSPVSGILITYTFTVSWFVGGLTAFHLYLVITNQTTYENFRYRYERRMNPYNLGCARNFRDILFSRIPKSRNNFRAKVKPDTSSHFCSSTNSGRAISLDASKKSFGIEAGKRQAVGAEDFTDTQGHVGNYGGLQRCGTQSTLGSWDHKHSWESTPVGSARDLNTLQKLQHATSDVEKIHEGH